MTPPLQLGDRVRISAHGAEDVLATVILASPDGRSLMLEFPGGLFGIAGAGAYVGSMPVLEQDDGRWIELINQREIRLEREPVVVHVLVAGRALCGRDGTPNQWRHDERWVQLVEATQATCTDCQAVLAEAFKCPRCGAVSFNPHDREHQYCGRCHAFLEP